MAVTGKLAGKFLLSLGNKEIDLDSDTFKVMLLTSAAAPDQDTWQYKSSVTNEITGAGYTAGGAALTSVTVSYDAATNSLIFDAADTTWAGATITARYALIYDSSPATDATRPIVGWIDFGADVISTGGPYVITWNAVGIFALAAA